MTTTKELWDQGFDLLDEIDNAILVANNIKLKAIVDGLIESAAPAISHPLEVIIEYDDENENGTNERASFMIDYMRDENGRRIHNACGCESIHMYDGTWRLECGGDDKDCLPLTSYSPGLPHGKWDHDAVELHDEMGLPVPQRVRQFVRNRAVKNNVEVIEW